MTWHDCGEQWVLLHTYAWNVALAHQSGVAQGSAPHQGRDRHTDVPYHKLLVCDLQHIHQLLYQAVVQNTVGGLLECVGVNWGGERESEHNDDYSGAGRRQWLVVECFEATDHQPTTCLGDTAKYLSLWWFGDMVLVLTQYRAGTGTNPVWRWYWY